MCHRHKFNKIIGHTESILRNSEGLITCPIRIYFTCKCGRVISKRYRDDDPFIDEEMGSKDRWSGYTWWLYKPLSNRIERSYPRS